MQQSELAKWIRFGIKNDIVIDPDNFLTIVRKGEGKLGPGIYHNSLAAGISCPGKTVHCYDGTLDENGKSHVRCYAKHLQQQYTNTDAAWNASYNLASWDIAAYEVITRLQLMKLKPIGGIMRLHVSGDFFSVEYVKCWQRMMQDHPHVTFFAYTRSWRVQAIWNALIEAATFPNFTLWLSTDPSTVGEHVPEGYRVATIMDKGVKRLDKFATCPEQLKLKANCESCGLCWKAKPGARLAFIEH